MRLEENNRLFKKRFRDSHEITTSLEPKVVRIGQLCYWMCINKILEDNVSLKSKLVEVNRNRRSITKPMNH